MFKQEELGFNKSNFPDRYALLHVIVIQASCFLDRIST